MSTEKCMAFCKCHESACHTNFGVLNRKQGRRYAEHWTDQCTECQQANHRRFLSQGCKRCACFTVKDSPYPDKNHCREYTDCIRLEWREISKHLLLRENKPNCLSQSCQHTEEYTTPSMSMGRIGWF